MWARARALLATTALRMALRHALLQVLGLTVMLAALFFVLDGYVARQIDTALLAEARALAALPGEHRAQSVALQARLRGEGRRLRHYRLEDAQGHRLAGDVPRWPEGLPADARVRRVALRLVADAQDDHDAHDTLPAIGLALGDGGRLLVAQAQGELEDLRELAFLLAAGMLISAAFLALVLGALLGWRWLGRIESINTVAGRIAAGDLSQRVPMSGRGDEFDLLAGHLNAMLARIEAALACMREVSDHVAHDLRRPLARLKTRIEVVLRQPRAADAYRQALTETLRDSEEILPPSRPCSPSPAWRRAASWSRRKPSIRRGWRAMSPNSTPPRRRKAAAPLPACSPKGPWSAARRRSSARPWPTCSTTPSSTRPRIRRSRSPCGTRARGRASP